LGRLYLAGAPVDWAGFDHDYPRRRVDLPTYPFAGEAYSRESVRDGGLRERVMAGSMARESLGEWLYEVTWQAKPGRAPAGVENPDSTGGDWLIFSDRAGVGSRMADRIRREGGRCVVVAAGEAYSAQGPDAWGVNPVRPEDFYRVMTETRPAGAAPWRAVVHLWSLDAAAGESMAPEDVEAAQAIGCGSLLHLVQAAVRGAASPIWAVTRRAQPVGSEGPAVAQAPIWGLGRVVALEHPEHWGGLVDLDEGDPELAAGTLREEIEGSDGEDQVAWRSDVRYVARLVRNRAVKMEPARWRSDGAYLITGGLGKLGLKIARWLAEQGARHLVLIGRSGLGDRPNGPDLPGQSEAWSRAQAVAGIEALGATVRAIAADVGNADQMAGLFAQFGRNLPPLRGVIHAAASPGSAPLRDMTIGALKAVLHPKVRGAWLLHRLTASMELDFFVLFSSTAALLGVKDLAHYAAANCFLDALAHHRRSSGRVALSINWGAWDELRAGSAEQRRMMTGAGLRLMASARALTALGDLLQGDRPQVVVAAVDWATLKPVYEAKRRRPLLEQLTFPGDRRAAPAGERSDILRQLEAARPQDRWELLVDHIRGEVAGVLRLDGGRTIDLYRGLFDLGLDSLMSVELKKRLEVNLGCELPSTLTFNYPNVGALADYLAKKVLPLEFGLAPERAGAPDPPRTGPSEGEDLSEDEL
ncbi:MAG TPA: KR domain-containing protein, partial [Vicinamibacteria bacterium]|nr:KR domain-containing protein [Vicinamibacteria bacterium]